MSIQTQNTIPECVDGRMNVDNKCIKGGRLLNSGLSGNHLAQFSGSSLGCAAFPIYLQKDVPYSGYAVGSKYAILESVRDEMKKPY